MLQAKYGVSFSIKQCQNFKLNPKNTLNWLIKDLGFRRFRLMSYWNELEKIPGEYDFTELDRQIKVIKKVNGTITLCLGARQPRWPENHWPEWAWKLDYRQRSEKLLEFVAVVVERYKNESAIISWQLENEALLKDFGERAEVDRNRLNAEFDLVKKIDPKRPLIMTTSTSWGIPILSPIPNITGFSLYNIVFNKGEYRRSLYSPWIFKLRAKLIAIIHDVPCFIHELQAEPWGPKAIWEMPQKEQDKSMNIAQLEKNIAYAQKTNLYPIDLWGGEWWYWRHLQGDKRFGEKVKELIS